MKKSNDIALNKDNEAFGLNRKRKKVEMILTIIAVSISIIIFAAIILFLAGVLTVANFAVSPIGIVYMLMAIVGIPAFILFLLLQRRKFLIFCLAYKHPAAKKHENKTMMYALVKYLLVIFAMIPLSYGIFIIPMLPIYFVVIQCAVKFMKLWKHHGYNVLILVGATIAALIVSIMLTPSIRTGAGMLFTMIR